MFIELIAAFIAGIGAAGVVLGINRLTGGRLPRWTMPVAAGAAMIGMALWSETTWASRTAEGLPESVEVAEKVSGSTWYRPWTYIWPLTTRMMAVDTASVQTNDAAPEVRLLQLYLFARWQPVRSTPQLVRCDAPARADVTDAALADPATANWREVPADSDLIRLACEENPNG